MNNIAGMIVQKKLKIALWGAGKNCHTYLEVIEKFCLIEMIVDINPLLEGTCIGRYLCQSPDMLKNIDVVVVTIDDKNAKGGIYDFCSEKGLEVCNYRDLLAVIYPVYEESFIKTVLHDADPEEKVIMKKYIGIDVPAYGCNLNCSYCYVGKKCSRETAFPELIHSPRYIRYRLRKEKIGGAALIGICANGETLFADKFVDICTELLKEGHYLMIVTNGTAVKVIKDIIKNAGEYVEHVIFKISFHYLELKKKGLLERFADNVNIINESKASYTLELMPHDELIEFIPEILSFSLKNFGAYPQLTVGRDERNNRELLTKLSKEEYIRTWKVFQSEMFDLKIKFYMLHGTNCNAGRDSFFIDLYSGVMKRCLFPENMGDFYDDSISLDFERVGDSCPLNYCFNCHAYLTMGVMPDILAPTYLNIRDRVREDGTHWIKEKMRRFLNTKFYEEYIDVRT